MKNSDQVQLLQGIANGSQQAFRELYACFNQKVYNTALSYMQHEQEAEEVVQDVFVKVHQHASRFEGKASVSTWIYRITVNTALTMLQKRKRFSFLQFGNEQTDSPNFEHPGVLLANKEKATVLFKAIDTLPAKQKTAFILSFVEGLPRQEVANIMEMNLKAVESLLQRAKKALRKKLDFFYHEAKD